MAAEQWGLIAVLSVIVGLDRTATTQFQLSRPLVCASLAGFVLQNFPQAFQLGLMLELLWITRIPVGAAISPDDTQTTIGGVVLLRLFATGDASYDLMLLLLVGVVAVICAELSKCFDVWARHRNEQLFQRAVSQLESDSWSAFSQQHYRGLVYFGCGALASLGLMLLVGGLLISQLGGVMAQLDFGDSGLASLVFPLVGVAGTLAVLRVRNSLPLFCGGFGITYLMLQMLEG